MREEASSLARIRQCDFSFFYAQKGRKVILNPLTKKITAAIIVVVVSHQVQRWATSKK